MPRRKTQNQKRAIGVDPIYGSDLVQKLINVIMKGGKKNVARTIVYDALNVLIKKNQGRSRKSYPVF